MGDRVLAVGGDGEAPVRRRVPADRRVDGPRQRIGVALHQRVVGLVDGPVTERPLEQRVRPLGRRHHHQTGRADVQAVDDPLALGRPGGGDAVPRRGQAPDHRGAGPADGGVRGHADRFVDDDDVRVRVQDRHPLDRLGDHGGLGPRFGHLDLDPGHPGELVGLAHGVPVEQDLALAGEVRHRGPRDAQEAGDTGVDAHAVEPVGDGEGADLTHRRGPSRRRRAPRIPASRRSRRCGTRPRPPRSLR